jgi:hypothetical protein
VPIPNALSPSDFILTILRNKLASKIRNYNLMTTHTHQTCLQVWQRYRLHSFKRYLKFSMVIPLNKTSLLQVTLSLKGLILRSPRAHCVLKTTLSYEGVRLRPRQPNQSTLCTVTSPNMYKRFAAGTSCNKEAHLKNQFLPHNKHNLCYKNQVVNPV